MLGYRPGRTGLQEGERGPRGQEGSLKGASACGNSKVISGLDARGSERVMGASGNRVRKCGQKYVYKEARVGVEKDAESREGFVVTGAPLKTGQRRLIV